MSANSERKTRTIGFRVSNEIWNQIEREVEGTSDTPHDWARKVILEKIGISDGFSKGQRLIYEELARVRYLVGYGFQLTAEGKLTPPEWEIKKTNADQKPEEIAKILLSRQRGNEHG